MSDFKPSELMADTVIMTPLGAEFIKNPQGQWVETNYHCVDDQMVVLDSATSENVALAKQKFGGVVDADSDLYFGTDFRIVAFPFRLVMSIVQALDDEYEGSTNDQIIRDHIEYINDRAKRLAEIAEETK